MASINDLFFSQTSYIENLIKKYWVYYNQTVEYKKIIDNAITPTRGSAAAAGYDLYVPREVDPISIFPHETKLISIGLAMKIPQGFFGAIFARSGLATKQGLRPANCVGVVDSDYRGEIMVALHNDSDETKTIEAGERIAQLVLLPFLNINFTEVENLDETERGDGGFGSTGK